jgi:hypothetical protein
MGCGSAIALRSNLNECGAGLATSGLLARDA